MDACRHGRTGYCQACYMQAYRSDPARAEKHRREVTAWQRANVEKTREKQRRYDARHRKPRATDEERFWAKVDKAGPIPSHQPQLRQCWVWTASCGTWGYGQARVEGRPVPAHRASWFFTYAWWPVSSVLHRCDNKLCVRPSHLFVGTQADNMRDMAAKGRWGNQTKRAGPG